jgi:hypothetical protein
MSLFDKVKDKASKVVSEQFDNLKTKDIGGKNIGDMIKPLEDKTNGFIDQREIDKTEQSISLQLIIGERLLTGTPNKKLRRDKDGYFYFSNHFDADAERYDLLAYDVRYPKYTSKTETKTTGTIKTKGRTGSALIGGALAGPTGAIVGASRDKKTTVDLTTKDVTTTKGPMFIKDPILTIKLKSTKDSSVKTLHVVTTIGKKLDNANEFFQFREDNQNAEQPLIAQSPVEQLKELKELLDLGILTQEEFELKKKEILGL